MKELPILFSTMMVQANMEDRKTNTRRLRGLEEINKYPDEWHYERFGGLAIGPHSGIEHRFYNGTGKVSTIKCPYGKSGDLLYVRESFQWMEGYIGAGYYVFKADFSFQSGEWVKETPKKFHDQEVVRSWRPSIHMPKEAARIWLQVTDIRVERLKDISEEDAIAEGVIGYEHEVLGWRFKDYYADAKGYGHPDHDYPEVASAVASFHSLWNKINGPESCEANPWVWVVSYKILSKTGKPELSNKKITE